MTMELKCYFVCVAVLSALATHTVQGFGLNDVIRALEARELRKAARDIIQTPENGITQIVLEELDENRDGKVALTEVRALLNKTTQGRHASDSIGYMMALVNIADFDDSGFIESSEIERAASILVTEIGDKILGEIVEMAVNIHTLLEGTQEYLRTNIPVVVRAFDRDGDGQITQQERDDILSQDRFSWMKDNTNRRLDSVDSNGDGVLNVAECTQMFEDYIEDYYSFRKLVVYAKVVFLAGFEVANSWAQN